MGAKKDRDGWQGFLKLALKMESPKALGELFELFFTHEERKTLGQRYLIIKALREQALTQREIADRFNVSISQITRGSNALKEIGPVLQELLAQES
jgi:TrpR family trp operon transcriptional repressor